MALLKTIRHFSCKALRGEMDGASKLIVPSQATGGAEGVVRMRKAVIGWNVTISGNP